MSSRFVPAQSSAAPEAARSSDRLFFTGMGLVVALTVFAGFARSYYLVGWLTPPERTPEITPLLHLHAVAFSAWIVLGVVQPALIAADRVRLHRTLGYAAAALAVAVWLLGNVVSIEAMERGFKGVGHPYAFYSVTFFSIQSFGLIVALGIYWRRDADTHKRLMLLSSAAILEAAVGRLPIHAVVETAPVSFYLGADLVIVAGAIYDFVSRGRVHRVWLWGGGALIASQLLRVAIMNSEGWLAFARTMASLG